MKLTRALGLVFAFTACLACGSPPPEDSLTEKLAEVMDEAPEPPALDVLAPNSVATLEKNRFMDVVRIVLPPGERIPEHDAGARAIFALSDCRLWVAEEGAGAIQSYAEYDATTWEPGRYSLENPGEDEAELVVVSRSGSPLPASVDTPQKAASPDVGSQPLALQFSDDMFEISSLEIDTDMERRLSWEHPCVLYTLTPAMIGVVSDAGGEPDMAEIFENRAIWLDRGSTLVVKAGADMAHLVVFQIKK